MEQPLSINNTRLPVELLGDVFHRLVEDDDNEVADFKLDNILLVCKIWRDAALSFTDLWSGLYICLDRRLGQDEHYWLRYTKTRLKRAGPTQLLGIHFTFNYPNRWAYAPSMKGSSHFQQLIYTLTGPQGVTAARWRSFEYHAPSDGGSSIALRLFNFPTPHLRDLHVISVHLDSLFPYTPRLTNVTLSDCSPPCLPFIKTVKILDLLVGNRGRRPVFLYLCDASSVTEFKLTCWPDFIVAPHCVLQSLVEFKFTGRLAIQSLERFAAPNLRRLTLLVDSGSSYPAFAQCTGVNFERLEYFHFGWPHRIEDASIREYLDAAQILLKKLSQLQTLSFERNSIAELALKLLVDKDADLFPAPPREGHLSLMLDGASCPIGYGSSRRQSIDEFRQMADLDVEKSWVILYRKCKSSLDF
ncbi:hypothetical protein PIIN_07151 [Serendipita indica DSM 11827]|uniref:F-box domain-containing protein n=1 Tax=Serendipita indica (strain DSM 11827) TaxID=1109443 RepID=G4TPF4_SERID|nr:hypothetical protein PIIN_07151 [Serendipita indica DSM 11827]